MLSRYNWGRVPRVTCLTRHPSVSDILVLTCEQ